MVQQDSAALVAMKAGAAETLACTAPWGSRENPIAQGAAGSKISTCRRDGVGLLLTGEGTGSPAVDWVALLDR
jgi:hypothetical protein